MMCLCDLSEASSLEAFRNGLAPSFPVLCIHALLSWVHQISPTWSEQQKLKCDLPTLSHKSRRCPHSNGEANFLRGPVWKKIKAQILER